MVDSSEVATFRDYLKSLPDELLEGVSEDYVWLSELNFENKLEIEFLRRRTCCREECMRRGALKLFQMAEQAISPAAAVRSKLD